MYFLKKLLKSLLRHRIYINFNPTAYLPSFNLNISFLSFIIIFISFSLFISFALITYAEKLDYYALKLENKILKNKLNNIITTAKEGIEYLQWVKRTQIQISKIIKEEKNESRYISSFIGGPSSEESDKLRWMLENINYSKLNETEIISSYKKIKIESHQRLSSYNEILNYITTKFNQTKALPAIWPVSGNITSPFGYRIHPFTLSYDFHSGIDISNNPGAEVKSTADGVVRYTGWAMGYGLCIIIDHGFGYTTLYGHLSQSFVKEGEVIKRGQKIGLLGSTGTSTGPHLHYEVWHYGVPQNPIKFLTGSKNGNT